MKVGFDISQLAHAGGVGTYTRNLTQELSNLADLEMLYFYSSLRRPYKGNLKGVKKFRLPPTFFEVMFNRMRNIPIEKFIGDVDIFHSSDWVQPPSKAKKVTTYHDVIPLKFPQWSHPKIVEVHKRRLEIVEKEIDMVIAVSKATKKDLLEVSNVPEEKITVVYEGVGKEFRPYPKVLVEDFRKKYKLPEKFVLIMGGVGERKNKKRLKEAARGYDVVIAGETIPYLPDEEMPLLYCSAQVLLYVTLYEGFGLPIVEAMACGLPFITNDSGACNEIGGRAGLYADPEDIDEIRKRIKQAFEDESWRKSIISSGIKRAEQFSWEKAALETMAVYKKVMENN